MSRAIGRAVATALLGALAGAAWLAFFYGWHPALQVDFAVDPPSAISGVYPVERDQATNLTFAWTGEQFTLRLPGLDRHVNWVLDLRVRGARAAPAPNPDLAFYVDGTLVLTRASATDFEDVRVGIPARPDQRGLTIAMRTSSTFVPGPADPRPLGVMLNWIRLAPSAIVLPPRRAFAGTALAAAALGAAIALLGVTAGSAVGAAIVIAAGTASIVGRGFGPYTDFPGIAARVGVWIAFALVAISTAVQSVRNQPFRNTARFVAAFTACALLFKLLVLLHPDMPIGDALFHAHRFQNVLAGNLYFTSIAPGNYQFPYAPGLYAFAVPFSHLVRRGAADISLLRIIVASADAVVAVLLYGMIVRARADRLAGAVAVALYHLIPLGFRVMIVGNLTNAFAQSLSVGAFAMMGAGSLRLERRPIVAIFAGVLVCAFLSHTSTFAILSVAAFLTAILFWWRGGPALRSPAAAVLAALSAALIIAIAIFYAHFIETYRAEFARIGSETAAGAADAGGRGIAERLLAVPRYLRLYLGIPALALAIGGASTLWRRGAADRLTLSVVAWALACSAFLAVGVLTPIDMRYYLASIPAVAVAAGFGAAAWWSAGGAARITSAVLLAWTVFVGVQTWWTALD